MRTKKLDEFITPLFADACKHTKNKSWRRCRFYFRGRMQCWWIFDFETDYTQFISIFETDDKNQMQLQFI
jgi:hypothetical protein